MSRGTNKMCHWCGVVDVGGIGLNLINMVGITIQFSTSLSFVQAAIDALQKVTKQIDVLYKETYGRIFVINAPIVFQLVFKMVRPLLSERTAAKVPHSIHCPFCFVDL